MIYIDNIKGRKPDVEIAWKISETLSRPGLKQITNTIIISDFMKATEILSERVFNQTANLKDSVYNHLYIK